MMVSAAAAIAATAAAITAGFRKLATMWNNGLTRAAVQRATSRTTQKPGVFGRRAECEYIPRVLKGETYQPTPSVATFPDNMVSRISRHGTVLQVRLALDIQDRLRECRQSRVRRLLLL